MKHLPTVSRRRQAGTPTTGKPRFSKLASSTEIPSASLRKRPNIKHFYLCICDSGTRQQGENLHARKDLRRHLPSPAVPSVTWIIPPVWPSTNEKLSETVEIIAFHLRETGI